MRTVLSIPVLAMVASLGLAEPEPELARAIQLPTAAHQLRNEGVPDADVVAALSAAEDHGLSAAEATEVLEAEARAGTQHGRIDGFGAFVKTQLDAGKRGKELAAAIHAEHEARGMGKSRGKGKGKSESQGKGKGKADGPEAHSHGKGKGKPDHAGGKGKPDHAGRDGGKGKPDHAGQGGGNGKPDHAGQGGGKGSGGGKGGGDGKGGGSHKGKGKGR